VAPAPRLDLARDALRGLPHAEIVVIGDGALAEPEPPPDLEGVTLRFVPVGKSAKNLAITQFSVRRYPLDKSRLEVMIEVANASAERADVELSLWGDGAIIDTERVAVAPGERLPRFLPDVGGTRRVLEARLRYADGRADDLPADDRAWALVPERRRAKVLVVTRGNTYLEAALLLDEYLDVTEITPDAYPAAGAFDVTIFDGVAPAPAANAGGLVYLDPPPSGAPVKLGKALEGFGFDTWDKKSPILRFAALGDVQVATGHALEPSEGDKIVGASDDGPILVSGARGGHRFVVGRRAVALEPRAYYELEWIAGTFLDLSGRVELPPRWLHALGVSLRLADRVELAISGRNLGNRLATTITPATGNTASHIKSSGPATETDNPR